MTKRPKIARSIGSRLPRFSGVISATSVPLDVAFGLWVFGCYVGARAFGGWKRAVPRVLSGQRSPARRMPVRRAAAT
jgi:hypothetical protein